MDKESGYNIDLLEKEGADQQVRQLVDDRVGVAAGEFYSKYIPNMIDPDCVLVDSSAEFNIRKQPRSNYQVIANLGMANQIRRINQFFIAANEKLAPGGLFICRAETISERKRRAYAKHHRLIADVYYFGDFLFHRVMPKISGLKKLYFFVTKGRRRVLSRAEILGRLVSCGFDIVEETEIDNVLHFVGKKNDKGIHTEDPSYGPLFKMNRIGKGGKIIGVYKMRTMHPYSEFLQDYIYQLNSLQEGGKFANDFRISTLGRIFRRFWIDELPMILNWLKGDMKLIGVRPLSRHYLSLYNDELKEMRKQVKPGLVPPYYADMPTNLEEIQASEMKYLRCYRRSPWSTDFKYFWKSFYNIVVKRARSK